MPWYRLCVCRLDAVGTASLERPSTAQRERGRVPLTVLTAEQPQAAGSTSGQRSASSSVSGAAAPAAAVTSRSTVSRVQGAATGRSDTGSSSWQREQQQETTQPVQPPADAAKSTALKVGMLDWVNDVNGITGIPNTRQSTTHDSRPLTVPVLHEWQPTAATCMHTNATCRHYNMMLCLCAQVVLSPQRPRTVISFENRCWSSDGPGSKPVLSMFPHTEGAKVC
jgi:hypothetical protein